MTVVLDKDQAEAMPSHSIGAFAALVGLAELEPCLSPEATLLSLFDSATAPQRLPTRDLDFLRRLYAR